MLLYPQMLHRALYRQTDCICDAICVETSRLLSSTVSRLAKYSPRVDGRGNFLGHLKCAAPLLLKKKKSQATQHNCTQRQTNEQEPTREEQHQGFKTLAART